MLPNITEIKVGIADYKTARSPEQIITLGLGSCVGVTLYDPASKIGGLVHIMLPDSSQFQNRSNPAKFADLGIPLLLEEILKLGAKRFSLQAKMAGGAQMFNFADKSASTLNIGRRNVEMAKDILGKLGIKLIAEDTGGNYGRTMILDTATGNVSIRSIGSPLRLL
ncbi:chemotaxis protein CheD [Zhaonella formicivorans]|uniref:chemotaxis protein CheD n=1 Tax=Zhaonella formicivorans TaxID=2528593 RepID=UPI0010EF916B|nr:chemotaxis protein CheD [Zhaonella formicivorans]